MYKNRSMLFNEADVLRRENEKLKAEIEASEQYLKIAVSEKTIAENKHSAEMQMRWSLETQVRDLKKQLEWTQNLIDKLYDNRRSNGTSDEDEQSRLGWCHGH